MRWASCPTGALWVTTSMVVPSWALTSISALSTRTPVALSRAPVGSSHSMIAGRLAIARAIAKRPAIMLCDEPTGALDSATGVRVLRALIDVNAQLGTTMLVVTHNAPVGQLAHRILRFADGRIGEQKVNPSRRAPEEISW